MAEKRLVMMPWFPESFIASTRGWTLVERAVYRELLDAQWIQGVLPSDESELIRLCGASRTEWKKAWPVVKKKFTETADGLKNDRLESHRAKAISISTKRKIIGSIGGSKRQAIAKQLVEICSSKNQAELKHDSDSDTSVLRTGGEPPSVAVDREDPKSQMWNLGVQILGAKSRSVIGQACKRVGEVRVGEVLAQMAIDTKADPVSWFIAATTPKARGLVL